MEYSKELFSTQILEAARNFGGDVALKTWPEGKSMSFEELRKNAYKFSKLLQSYDVNKGEIVCVAIPNSIEYVITFLGCAIIGGAIAGFSPQSKKEEISTYLSRTKAKVLVVSEDSEIQHDSYGPKFKVIKVGEMKCEKVDDFWKLLEETEADYTIGSNLEITLDDMIMAPFSSGTTGIPKCVMLTHRNFNVATAALKRAVFDRLMASRRSSYVSFLPFYHSSGFWPLCYCLLEGHTTLIMKQFHPILMLECIELYKLEVLNVVPSIVRHLCETMDQTKNFDVSSLTTVLCGAAPISKDLCKTFLNHFKNVKNFMCGYGMTEEVVLSHISPLGIPLENEELLGSCGKLLPGFQAKIIDLASGEETRGIGKSGELLIKSEAVMKGYFDDVEATKKAIDEDGWLHTGDIVCQNSDGFFFVVDRIKNLIKVNGLQVSPLELERILETHWNIAEAKVIGIPDEHYGEVPRAYVVLSNSKSTLTTPEMIKIYVRERVAPHKQLHGGVKIVVKLPRTASGKVRRPLTSDEFNC